MMRSAKSDIAQAVGNTPIVKLNHVAKDVVADIYVKCEYLNPMGSHKDRVARNMIAEAELRGLKPGGTIVEATAGNTGLGLALVEQIARRHGGRVHCEARPGGGSCFVITLPAERRRADAAPTA